MQITPISNNNIFLNQTAFKAGKIKVLNSSSWTDSELKAFANNEAYKTLANSLKKKNLDLYVAIRRGYENSKKRSLELFTGKSEMWLEPLQTIQGALWREQPEAKSLVDSIISFPVKIETLFEEENPEIKLKIKDEALKELRKFNKNGGAKIIINHPDNWKASELKALVSNNNFKLLANKLYEEDFYLLLKRDYNQVLDEQYIEILKVGENNKEFIGTIYSNRSRFENKPISIADGIATFKEPNKQVTIGETREEALNDIELFNSEADTNKKTIMNFFKKLFQK